MDTYGAGARDGAAAVRSLGGVSEPDDPTAVDPAADGDDGAGSSLAPERREAGSGTEVSDEQRDRRTGFFRESETAA